MVTFSESSLINAPLEKVFSFVSDFKRIPEWRKDVPGISQISGPAGVGATFVEEVNFMGKKQLQMKVLEYLPNQKLVIEALSGMPLLPTQSFLFKTEGNKTRIELEVNMKTFGIFKLLGFMMPGQLKKIWQQYFRNLDQVLAGAA